MSNFSRSGQPIRQLCSANNVLAVCVKWFSLFSIYRNWYDNGVGLISLIFAFRHWCFINFNWNYLIFLYVLT